MPRRPGRVGGGTVSRQRCRSQGHFALPFAVRPPALLSRLAFGAVLASGILPQFFNAGNRFVELYDICMLVVLVGATLLGAWKGMAWQIASSASLVLSYLVALRFSEQLAPRFGQQAPLNRFIAMFVLYMATSLVIWVVFRIVAGFINRVRLREFDRQMGALFGAAKGVLFCVAITFFAVTLSDRARTAVLESRSGYVIARLLDRAPGVMPRELHDVLHPYLNRLEKELNSDPAPRTATAPLGHDA
jgi:membrane protein required for colicin V production